MHTMRVDLYTAIHKAQRFHMFQLANAIGGADLESDDTAGALAGRVREIVEHLRDHARNEETYIHPLFDAAGTGAGPLREEHDELEADLGEIERVVGEGRRQDLYPAYTRFLGKYLLHLSEEEEAQRQVLWLRYDDDTLRGVLDRFKAERPRDKADADLAFILPALSAPELASLFRGMKQAAASDVFGRACEQARRLVAPDKWQLITGAIAAE